MDNIENQDTITETEKAIKKGSRYIRLQKAVENDDKETFIDNLLEGDVLRRTSNQVERVIYTKDNKWYLVEVVNSHNPNRYVTSFPTSILIPPRTDIIVYGS